MTVTQLIENLKDLPPDAKVVVWYDSGPRGDICGLSLIRANDPEVFRFPDEKWELKPFVIVDCDGELSEGYEQVRSER